MWVVIDGGGVGFPLHLPLSFFEYLSSLSFSFTSFFFFSLYLPLNQPSMVEMWHETHGSVVGFHFWRYGFHGSMDGFHFWWCGWPDFFVPWFGGCGFCGLVVGNLMVIWVVG